MPWALRSVMSRLAAMSRGRARVVGDAQQHRGLGRSGSSGSSPLRMHHYFQNFIASFQLQM